MAVASSGHSKGCGEQPNGVVSLQGLAAPFGVCGEHFPAVIEALKHLKAKAVTIAFETGQETADLLRLTLD